MRLRLLYKSYAVPGLALRQGEEHEFGDAEGARLLRDFPAWWEAVDSEPALPPAEPRITFAEAEA